MVLSAAKLSVAWRCPTECKSYHMRAIWGIDRQNPGGIPFQYHENKTMADTTMGMGLNCLSIWKGEKKTLPLGFREEALEGLDV